MSFRVTVSKSNAYFSRGMNGVFLSLFPSQTYLSASRKECQRYVFSIELDRVRVPARAGRYTIVRRISAASHSAVFGSCRRLYQPWWLSSSLTTTTRLRPWSMIVFLSQYFQVNTCLFTCGMKNGGILQPRERDVKGMVFLVVGLEAHAKSCAKGCPVWVYLAPGISRGCYRVSVYDVLCCCARCAGRYRYQSR